MKYAVLSKLVDAQEEQELLDKEMAGLKGKQASNDSVVKEEPVAA